MRSKVYKQGHLLEKELVVCEVIYQQRKSEECSLGLGCECWMAYQKSELYSFEEGSFFLFKRFAWLQSVFPVLCLYLANTSRNSYWGPEQDRQPC